MMTKRQPTLDELHDQLADARSAYDMCKFIDSTPRMLREQREWADEITRLLGEIRAREAKGEKPGNGGGVVAS